VAGVDVRSATIELVEVEEEVDLHGSLIAGELAEARGEGVRVKRGRSDGEHGAPPVMHLRITRILGLRKRTGRIPAAILGRDRRKRAERRFARPARCCVRLRGHFEVIELREAPRD
jgi:hypothetical protein